MSIVSTGLAIGLGIYFKPRVWCTVCPIQTCPGAYKEQGQVPSIDCLGCSNCVTN